jgi:hypothetical protein
MLAEECNATILAYGQTGSGKTAINGTVGGGGGSGRCDGRDYPPFVRSFEPWNSNDKELLASTEQQVI